MNKIKKILLTVFLLLIAVLNSACVFPDRLPDLKKLKTYSPQKIEYGKTTLQEFKKNTGMIPDSDIEVYTDGVTIIKLKPADNDNYNLIRAGFKNDKLDWIEFNLVHKVEMTKLINIYGKSTDINSTYSTDLDYYNYDFFNIASDKNRKFAKSITYFGKSSVSFVDNKVERADIPVSRKKRFFEQFALLEPGITTESDFSSHYPDLIPYIDEKSETTSIYVMTDELEGSRYYYDKAIMKFENGLLTWINLIPRSLPLNDCLKSIKTPYKKENVDTAYDLYDFSKFILIVDKKSKTVKSIGLFSRDVKL